MVWSDERRDPLALRHSPLSILPGGQPSRRDAAVKPVDLQEQPMEVPKEQARLRGAPTRWEERPTGLRTAATGPHLEETRLGRGMSAAPLPPWIVARSAHG
jgi:hypothetical protein